MFEREISLFYRIICLLIYLVVIIFSDSFITPIFLIIFFVLATRYFDNALYILVYLLSIIALILTFIFKINIFLKVVAVACFVLYFFNATNLTRIFKFKKKERIVKRQNEFDYIRFKKPRIKNISDINDLGLVCYITFHFAIVFLSIMVGICVI